MLREIQAAMRRGVLDPAGTADWSPAREAMAGDHIGVEARFSVYRNNVLGSLAGALEAAFPVVCRLVGEEFFGFAARLFVAAHPPAAPQLLGYGGEFAAFLARFEPAQSVPCLPDVARLEWAQIEALFAADARPLTAADLQDVPPEAVAGLRFRLHPSARLVASRFPVLTIWRANQPEHETVPPIDPGRGGEAVLVVRPGLAVEMVELTPGAFALLAALHGGATLAEAAGAAELAEPGLDLQHVLAIHLMTGSFGGIAAG